jgi:hypothetical protein
MLAATAHIFLAVTVWYLFPFLMHAPAINDESAVSSWWYWDSLLILQFGLSHSLLLHVTVRDKVECYIPRALYGCLFTLITCLSLLFLIWAWTPCPAIIWELTGAWKLAVNGAYVLSWVALLYSLSLDGWGFQTGWTPYWAWVRGRPTPRRRFQERGAYRIVRHPVYLSFLGQIWFTQIMTLDRALLVGLLTTYIFLGSYLKDRRLIFYLGDAYRRYQARVPGYPLAWGPLGRVSILGPETAAPLAKQ